jgi:hypothetical protein
MQTAKPAHFFLISRPKHTLVTDKTSRGLAHSLRKTGAVIFNDLTDSHQESVTYNG